MRASKLWVKRLGVMAALTLLALFAAPLTADAQCIGADGMDFNGNCCDISEPILPDFPGIEDRTKYICWRDCRVAKTRDLCVEIGAPTPHFIAPGIIAGCGVFDVPVKTKTCGAAAREVFSGTVIGTYARTWFEDADFDGDPETQVWRILLNGDLEASDFLLAQFGNNPCIPQAWRDYDGLVYWYGYIDYRLNCQTNEWQVEWALDHECDKYHHNSDSERPAPPGGYSPDRSFTFVGPASFVPTLAIPFSSGPMVQENTRTIAFTGPQNPARCFIDDPIREGFVDPFQETCVCVDGEPQYALQEFGGTTICGTGFGPGQGKDFVQKKLGFFVDAAGNPTKALLLEQGDLTFVDQCVGTQTNEYFEGVITIGNAPAFTFDPAGALIPLGRQFHDIGSSNDEFCNRKKGAPRLTCKLICANTP